MAMKMQLIGELPKARLASLQIEKPGKLTVVFKQEYFGNPMAVEAPDIGGIGLPPNLAYSSKSIEPGEGGEHGELTWKYESSFPMPSSPTDDRDEDDKKRTVSMEVSLTQVALTMHPNIEKIMSMFGGAMKDGELTFPINDPTGASTRRGYDKDGTLVMNVNPFYNVTGYMEPSVKFRTQQMDEWSGVVDDLGMISEPPGGFQFGGGRNWIKLSASERTHGRNKEVSEEWLLSGQGGWEPTVYSYRAKA